MLDEVSEKQPIFFGTLIFDQCNESSIPVQVNPCRSTGCGDPMIPYLPIPSSLRQLRLETDVNITPCPMFG
jgi:hypothetical protein